MLNNQLVNYNSYIEEFNGTKKLCTELMRTAHYARITEPGIYAIVERARSIGVNPFEALNGGMYFVKGKVEMSAAMMNRLIRSKGHSITKDKKSDDTICILHGKRADNGDTWSESFSIKDAQTAGIYGNVWKTYPKDMLFARALSRLARQLFSDVIGGCYVEDEIACLKNNNNQNVEMDETTNEEIKVEEKPKLSEENYNNLLSIISRNPSFEAHINAALKNVNIDILSEMPQGLYEKIVERDRKNQERNDETQF